MLIDLPWQWALALSAAFLAGFNKTGIAGVGILGVILMALVMDVNTSTGVVLPLLIVADLFAVAYYRRHADWKKLVKLIPAAVGGIAIGHVILRLLTGGEAPDKVFGPLIGGIVLTMMAVKLVLDYNPDKFGAVRGHWGVAVVVGILAGITTMLANAAGPVMVIYLLAMGLPKRAFMGTAAWYFLILNWVKVPGFVFEGRIDSSALATAACLVPATIGGAMLGPWVLKRIRQERFRLAVTVLAIVGSVFVIVKPWVMPMLTSTDRTPPAEVRVDESDPSSE